MSGRKEARGRSFMSVLGNMLGTNTKESKMNTPETNPGKMVTPYISQVQFDKTFPDAVVKNPDPMTNEKVEKWKLVPTEPTQAMLSAAFDGMVIDMDVMRHVARINEVAATYARMLAAAPSTLINGLTEAETDESMSVRGLSQKAAPSTSTADALDAARYRWLRSTTNFVSNKDGERIDVRGFPLAWDEAIDAAIVKGGA